MKWKEGAQFENPPAGSHIALCYAVIDLGTNPHSYNNESWMQRDVRISFELPFEKMEGIYDEAVKGKPFSVHFTGKQSLHPKAKLRKMLAGWRGRDFKDKSELEAFDPKKLVGLPCRVNLVQNGEYMNIDSISPLSKSDKAPKKTINKMIFFSLEADEFNPEVFKLLHEKTREKISKTPEYQKLSGAMGGDEAQPDAPEEDGASLEPDSENPF